MLSFLDAPCNERASVLVSLTLVLYPRNDLGLAILITGRRGVLLDEIAARQSKDEDYDVGHCGNILSKASRLTAWT